MRGIRYSLLTVTAAAAFLLMPSPKSDAQVSIGVNIGPAPSCPYGYYDYAPYDCAPDGYYGPEWFVGGHFVGAGQWFHGPANFHGSVNNHFDPQHGYKGAKPGPGPEQPHHAAFKGNEARDGRGHVTGKK